MTSRDLDTGRAPLSRWRAVAFATMSVGIGLVGHQLAAGTPLPWWLAIAAFAVGCAYGRVLCGARLDWFGVLAGAAAIQAGIHLVGSSLHPSHLQHAHGPAVHELGTSSSDAWMLVFHVVATIVGVVLLLALERRLWHGVRAVASIVARSIGWRSSAAMSYRTSLRVRPLVSCDVSSMSSLDAATLATRRGPPQLQAA